MLGLRGNVRVCFSIVNNEYREEEEMAFAKTSPRRRIPNLRRTCWSIVPMAKMRLICYISDVKSSLSMIFMGIFRWVG